MEDELGFKELNMVYLLCAWVIQIGISVWTIILKCSSLYKHSQFYKHSSLKLFISFFHLFLSLTAKINFSFYFTLCFMSIKVNRQRALGDSSKRMRLGIIILLSLNFIINYCVGIKTDLPCIHAHVTNVTG